MSRLALAAALLVAALPVPGRATERVPVAVLWMGDAASLEAGGAKTVDAINAALPHTATARPIDSLADRQALLVGGPATELGRLLIRAEASFVKLDYAAALRDYEAAEVLVLGEVPLEVARRAFGPIERNLLACYDQLGRGADAARAAERLSWTDSAKAAATLVERHLVSRQYQPAAAPVTVESTPPGALVQRNLVEVGATPHSVAGGDPKVDFVDLVAPGYRRAHRPLGAGEAIKVALVREDRVGLLVDRIRAQAPDAAPKEVAALGGRVGAERLLVLLPDDKGKLLGRWFDVDKARWADEPVRVDASGAAGVEALCRYVAPVAPAAPPAGKETHKSRLGPWGKWYTWVAAGGVVALVAGILIAQNVGSDSLQLKAVH